jgi:hypothetical protein
MYASAEAERYTEQVHQVFREVEKLVRDFEIALDENDDLRSRLLEANIEIDFLRRQVQQLSEALKTNRPSIVKSMLKAVGAITLAVAGGVGGATGGHLFDEAAAADPTTADLIERCSDLADQLESVERLANSSTELP